MAADEDLDTYVISRNVRMSGCCMAGTRLRKFHRPDVDAMFASLAAIWPEGERGFIFA